MALLKHSIFALSACIATATLLSSTALSATKSSAKTKEERSREVYEVVQKEAKKPVRKLMYDGMHFNELEKKISRYESYRWNDAEYNTIQHHFPSDKDVVDCVNIGSIPLQLYYLKPEDWSYRHLSFSSPLPVSFSCRKDKKSSAVNLRILDSVVRKTSKGTYTLSRMYRSIPLRHARFIGKDNNQSEFYALGYQSSHKWTAFEFQTGYMFSTFLDGFFEVAQRNQKISEYYKNMRNLFKSDVTQCFVNRLHLGNENLDTFFNITATYPECIKMFDEVFNTQRSQDARRIRQHPDTEDEGAYQVEADNWYEQFVMKDKLIYDWFTELSNDIEVNRTMKIFEYAYCKQIEHDGLKPFVQKYAKNTNCASANRVLGKNLSSYYENKEFLRFVYYYSQAGQADKGQHCFYPKVFSTISHGNEKEVRSAPGSNVFCTDDEHLEETLQASYAALQSQFSGYSYESPIFIPVGFLKLNLVNMDGVLFPDFANLGPRSVLSTGSTLSSRAKRSSFEY